MATLNLFPARIQFVDSKGCLTPEAYRALQGVYARLGGSFGDQGIDVFSDITAQLSDGQLMSAESVMQPDSADFFVQCDTQEKDPDFFSEIIYQPPSRATGIQSVTVGASPFSYVANREGSISIESGTVTNITLARYGVTVSTAMISGFVPMSEGDQVTITYTVAPTIKFIPR